MEITVLDDQGNRKDLEWLRGKYGNFRIKPAAPGSGPVYKIVKLKEIINAPGSISAFVETAEDTPAVNLAVAWYWPDAPEDADAGPLGGVLEGMRPGRALTVFTKENGEVAPGIGHGSYYFPQEGQVGLHAYWVHGAQTRSDLIHGLGMVGQTNHSHFQTTFRRFEQDPDDNGGGAATPPIECPEEMLAELDKIEAAINAMRDMLA